MKTIRVTTEDILLGTPTCTTRCPVALAIRREFDLYEDWGDVSVSPKYLRIKHESIPTPEVVKDFIHRFDTMVKGEPFEFEIQL